MKDGIYKVAAATPHIRVGDCNGNAEKIMRLIERAENAGASVLVLPELCVTGYTAGDLFLLDSLIGGSEEAVDRIADFTEGKDVVVVLGAPAMMRGKLYSAAFFIQRGRVLGIVPKAHVPNYSEFYEARMFAAYDGDNDFDEKLNCPFGTKLIFAEKDGPLAIAAEICEDLWVPDSPSVVHALAGALVVCNPSASDETIAKADYRRSLVAMQSAKLCCAYIYADAGKGESTTDTVYAGHNLIAENGRIAAEGEPFADEFILADIDLQFLAHERRRMTSFGCGRRAGYTEVRFELNKRETVLERKPDKNPFVPAVKGDLDRRAEEILRLQTAGLAGRLSNCGIKRCVVGVSGGLDSTLALLVAVRAVDAVGLPRKNITAVTMPCFGTTGRTRRNAEALSRALGTDFRVVDIGESVKLHLRDIGHDGSTTDVAYENAQARERTQVLFDIANMTGAVLVGTGDLSELALGWCTDNGDQMSSYAVNASGPKTLVRRLVAYEAERLPAVSDVLRDVLDTPVSPELLPTGGDVVVQPTEEIIGPYELHDFFLYHLIRRGSSRAKIRRLAIAAFEDEYSAETIDKWLGVFFRRFFSSAFKRNCLPDGAKVGSVSLSPRGDWRMPSDSAVIE